MTIRIQDTNTVLPCPHCGEFDCVRQTNAGVHYCANTLYPITQTQVSAQVERMEQEPVLPNPTSKGGSLFLGAYLMSLRWAGWSDPLWWVYDGEFAYTHLFDISIVKSVNFRAVQVVVGPVKLSVCWKP